MVSLILGIVMVDILCVGLLGLMGLRLKSLNNLVRYV